MVLVFAQVHKRREKSEVCLFLVFAGCLYSTKSFLLLLRKEVIQPHLPVRLPCYDFTPLTRRTLDASFLAVKLAALGAPNSGGVTGGVYKARERIHRSLADLRLLAIPASCSRVADCSPNWDRLLRICQTSRSSSRLCRPL